MYFVAILRLQQGKMIEWLFMEVPQTAACVRDGNFAFGRLSAADVNG